MSTVSALTLGRPGDPAAVRHVRFDAVTPGDVDGLAFTHLHFDHAGWAFTRASRTFSNARPAGTPAEGQHKQNYSGGSK